MLSRFRVVLCFLLLGSCIAHTDDDKSHGAVNERHLLSGSREELSGLTLATFILALLVPRRA